MDTLYIVIPTYNEQENIEEVVSEWYPVIDDKGDDSRLVVVNDGSRDNTLDILNSLKEKYPKLTVLDKDNGGHGPAVLYGYDYAVKNGADYVFQTDSDLQTDPGEFGQFWDEREKNDAIFGYRPHRGDGLSRFLVEKVVCILLFLSFRVKVPDANAPYRLFKADLFKHYLDIIEPDYALPNIILTAFYAYKKNDISFVPISFTARKRGKQKMNIKKIIRIGFKSINDFKHYRKKIGKES
ncbi:MAG: glycosyltransferase family 2 protein [Lachnospiraceae bacterium]|nr:glycosyltransferase family 2 protein [Lachnospiraceae bacterium]